MKDAAHSGRGVARRQFLLSSLLLGVSACASSSSEATITNGVVLDGVTIVNTRDGSLAPRMAIALSDQRITHIAPTGALRISGAAQTVSMPGKYVVPGYLDMHTHPQETGDAERALQLMLANGVTGYRQMSGSLEELQRREQRTNLAQPSCLAMPGAVLTMANARTPDMAIAEVRAQKEAGADFIKSVFVPREVFFAALTEATRQGLPFVGHLPPSVTPSEAAAAGMRAIEHLGPGPNYLLSCSGEEASLRAAMAPPAGGRPPALTPEVIVNPMLLTSPAEMNAYARLLDTFDQQKCEALARIFGDHEVWQTPTLIRLHTMAFGDAPTYQNDPNLRFADTSKRALWINAAERFATRFQQVDRAILGRLYQQQAHITALFAATNVKMLAGSDLGGQWLIPGFSLHQEFDKLAEAGVPPLHILQMATLNGAEFLGRSAAMGTVEVGKVADLVLLDADPVERADNLHRISAVVRAGALYSRGQLDEMLRASQQA